MARASAERLYQSRLSCCRYKNDWPAFDQDFRIQLSEVNKNEVWHKLSAVAVRILVQYFELSSADIWYKIKDNFAFITLQFELMTELLAG